MRRSLCILLLFGCSAVGAQDSPGRKSGPSLDDILQRGVHEIMLERFAVADSLFMIAADRYPHHPAGPVMRVAVAHLSAEEELRTADGRLLDSLDLIAEIRGEQYTVETDSGRRALAFVSSARGIMSLTAAKQGAWIRGFRHALLAASLGEEILVRDSSVADAGLAVGNYYYWKSRRVEFLTWLPFVVDSRPEGIELLRQCAQHGMYQRYAAINSLSWILMDAGRVEEARVWVDSGLRDYPLNKVLLRTRAAVQKAAGDLNGAIASWEEVRRVILRGGRAGSWGEYEALVRIAEIRWEQGDAQGTTALMDRIERMERDLGGPALSRKRQIIAALAQEIRRELTVNRSSQGPAGR